PVAVGSTWAAVAASLGESVAPGGTAPSDGPGPALGPELAPAPAARTEAALAVPAVPSGPAVSGPDEKTVPGGFPLSPRAPSNSGRAIAVAASSMTITSASRNSRLRRRDGLPAEPGTRAAPAPGVEGAAAGPRPASESSTPASSPEPVADPID